MKNAARIAAALFSVISLSCMTASPQAQKIRVTSNPEAVKGCKFLGNVEGNSGFSSGVASNNAQVEMRERAAKLGANVILAVSLGTNAMGEAYLCSNPNQ